MNNQPGMSLDRFKEEYEGQPAWDIGAPQAYFVNAFTDNKPASPVLDIGCGTGDLSLFVASLGCDVVGIDFAPGAIAIANDKLSKRGGVSFKVHDAFELETLAQPFNTVLDCCFFHMLDDDARKKYASLLHRVMAPGGQLYLLNFAVALPTPNAPRGVSQQDIAATFADGWSITELGATMVAVTFLPDGLPGTYACIEKKA